MIFCCLDRVVFILIICMDRCSFLSRNENLIIKIMMGIDPFIVGLNQPFVQTDA